MQTPPEPHTEARGESTATQMDRPLSLHVQQPGLGEAPWVSTCTSKDGLWPSEMF